MACDTWTCSINGSAANAVFGGLCAIAVTLNEHREVVQLAPMQSLGFGERDGKMSDRVRAIADAMSRGKFGAAASEQVIQDMWEKWVFLASLAASTCPMRAPIGHILAAPGGRDFILGILDECSAVAAAEGHSPARSVLRARAGNVDRGRFANSPPRCSATSRRARGSRPITSSAI